jgi:hypothetical protein
MYIIVNPEKKSSLTRLFPRIKTATAPAVTTRPTGGPAASDEPAVTTRPTGGPAASDEATVTTRPTGGPIPSDDYVETSRLPARELDRDPEDPRQLPVKTFSFLLKNLLLVYA